jgi:hypothetical protein
MDGVNMEYERRALPFYMTYPGSYHTRQDESVIRDLEYLHQTYPAQVKRYHRRVAEILDKTDYEGSMIYDEYPDRCCLQQLTKTIAKILKEEDARSTQTDHDAAKWEWMEQFIQVLVCDEIYKRRHGGRRRFVKF